ncbi:MAG: YcaO-like family protein [Deltaproteobacteria bacterium]|nr:YcaO-like family protein [Deltaproteobacteria bacterium]
MQFTNYIRNACGKCDSPEETIDRIKQGLDRLGLTAGYGPVRASDHLYWGRIWIDAIKIVCEGKGVTPALCEASAYAELVERMSAGLFYPVFEEQVRFNIPALYHGDARRFLNFEWMRGYVHAHQDELEDRLGIEELLVNEAHLTREDFTAIKASDMARHWVDGYSVLRQKWIKVPVNFVAYIHGSNGMAAGNTLEEAMIQAVCEILERYIQIRVIKPERQVPTIARSSIQNPLVWEMIRFYEGQDIDVLIKDLSLNDTFPVMGVLYTNRNLPADRPEHKMLIPGASFTLEEGLIRCFTEGIQGRTSLKKPRSTLDRPIFHNAGVEDYYMLMRCGVAMKDISFLEKGEVRPYADKKCRDLFGEIDEIKRICRQLNTDLILLDHTHPVLEFPVVRVVIPGVSDFLPFLRKDVLVSEKTRPPATLPGSEFMEVMQSFFHRGPSAR